MSSPSYSAAFRQTPGEVAERLREFMRESDHEFWPDSLSACDTGRIRHEHILTTRHLTNVYLLALAVECGGRLVTFDRGIPRGAVPAASEKHLALL